MLISYYCHYSTELNIVKLFLFYSIGMTRSGTVKIEISLHAFNFQIRAILGLRVPFAAGASERGPLDKALGSIESTPFF
jgi:hypothetical protein